MIMQQQIRIITTKKGYEEIMSFLRSHNNKKLTKNIVNVLLANTSMIYIFLSGIILNILDL